MAEIEIAFTGQKADINEFGDKLFELDSVNTGTQKDIPAGGTITMGRMLMRKAVGAPQVIYILLSLGRDVAAGVAGSYIYDKWKSHKGGQLSMTINRREVNLDKGEITRVIEEEIKIQKDEE
jgi:hypothetical protein